ncbi:hypothetical protein [Sorangium cellulosum]|uniref:hypothetical protein n=1 Tax=Sorangium cellulosum TaxID=56 RepID=UPI0009B644AC|nr:hypothetical protein [Sorangium cellulosum]
MQRRVDDRRFAARPRGEEEARARASGETTFAEFAERVVSEKLAEEYPDHVKVIRRPDLYRGRLKHLLDVLGPLPLVRLTLDHADRGAVVLDENRTDDPRAWALSPDVVRALRKWREVCPDEVRVFVGKWGCNSLPGQNGAARFRDHLRRAGFTRPEPFETTDSRLNNRLHDTRISDRTGYRSSGQIHHDKRAARKVAELGSSDFAPLDEAIPELRGKGGSAGADGPVDAAPEARAANEAAAALPSQAPTACDVAGPLEADLEAPESGGLGPRWATPEASAVEHRPAPIEIINLHADCSAAPGKSWRNEFAVPNRRDPSLHPGFGGHQTTDRTRSEGIDPTRAQPPTLELGELAPADPSARAAVVASLAGTLSRAVALGDEDAARVVHEAIGRLLGLSAIPEG